MAERDFARFEFKMGSDEHPTLHSPQTLNSQIYFAHIDKLCGFYYEYFWEETCRVMMELHYLRLRKMLHCWKFILWTLTGIVDDTERICVWVSREYTKDDVTISANGVH